MSEYAASELSRLREAGPYPGDDFFRLRVWGNGSTKHVNITDAELAAIINVVEASNAGG